MNYELANQLKDAGFPQPKNTMGVCDFTGETDKWYCKSGEYPVYHPTLSELISACGHRFYCLKFRMVPHRPWEAWAKLGANHALAETPEEAVAKLWLALHEKN